MLPKSFPPGNPAASLPYAGRLHIERLDYAQGERRPYTATLVVWADDSQRRFTVRLTAAELLSYARLSRRLADAHGVIADPRDRRHWLETVRDAVASAQSNGGAAQ